MGIKEIEQFGLNAATIGFLGTLFFGAWRVWALFKQKKMIWDSRSGASVSSIRFFYDGCLSWTGIIYGIKAKSLALGLTGTSSLFVTVLILAGLKKFKKFSRKEIIWFFAMGAAAKIMIFLPLDYARGYFLAFAMLGFIPVIHQIKEIVRADSAGVVDARLIIANIVSSIFWTIYGFATDEWPIMVLSPTVIVTQTITLIFWIRHKK